MAATEMMTGCGSILWMAPEILLGEKYNEKVDVFSYAMCLLELTNRNLPWHGSGVGQQAIPVRPFCPQLSCRWSRACPTSRV